MNINAQMVKELRIRTSAGIMDCKEALKACQGNLEKAVEYLRKKGIKTASSKFKRQALSGKIESYIHLYGKIGVLVEVNCETDFVANTEDFKIFVKDIAMQIAASNPKYITRNDVPKNIIDKEKEIIYAQMEKTNKPAKILNKIVEGKLEKYFQENCLLEQLFIKDDRKTVNDLLLETIGKLGENIIIKRFARFKLGEEI
ncbi:MAG TPA: elongation factor Ts [Candidatus Atribacteria bacterium]|nr:elongation factor Ts [Candidatus Atribacteria bacterium]